MRSLCLALLLITCSCAQDQPSVADAARKNRKGAAAPVTKKVYTTEDMAPGKSPESELTLPDTPNNAKPSNKMSLTPDQVAIVKEKIARFKKYIASLAARRAEIKQWQEDRKNETAHCSAQQQVYGYSACDTVNAYQQELDQVERKLKTAQSELATYQEKIRQRARFGTQLDVLVSRNPHSAESLLAKAPAVGRLLLDRAYGATPSAYRNP